MSFLGTSFNSMHDVLLAATGQFAYPIRLNKEEHATGVSWALANAGEAKEPWQQLHDALSAHGTIEVHIQD